MVFAALRCYARGSLPLLAAIVAPRPRWTAPYACAAAVSLRPRLDSWLQSTISNEERRRVALTKEAEAARNAERLSQWATLVVANLYRIDDRTTKIVVEDWEKDGAPTELTFEAGQGSPREQADRAFDKARRLRRGSTVVAGLIEESEKRERILQGWRARLAAEAEEEESEAGLRVLRSEILREGKRLKLKLAGLEEEGEAPTGGRPLPRGKRAVQQQQTLFASQTAGWGGREFQSPRGVAILVGRNRRENEQLSLTICRDPDVWMHGARRSPRVPSARHADTPSLGANFARAWRVAFGRSARRSWCSRRAATIARRWSAASR